MDWCMIIDRSRKRQEHLPVIIRFERAILVEAHVFGLLVSQLCQVGIKVG